jgi:hypothetical protein
MRIGKSHRITPIKAGPDADTEPPLGATNGFAV